MRQKFNFKQGPRCAVSAGSGIIFENHQGIALYLRVTGTGMASEVIGMNEITEGRERV